MVDDIAIVRSMHTEAINHDPAVTFFGTGNQQPGRPTMGAWALYGLGSESKNLPGFVVLTSGVGTSGGASNFSSGWMPSHYQGTLFRNGASEYAINGVPCRLLEEALLGQPLGGAPLQAGLRRFVHALGDDLVDQLAALDDDAAVREVDVIGYFTGEAHFVCDDDHGHALVRQLPHDREHAGDQADDQRRRPDRHAEDAEGKAHGQGVDAGGYREYDQ